MKRILFTSGILVGKRALLASSDTSKNTACSEGKCERCSPGVIQAVRKRKYCTPPEFQREGSNASLKLEFEEYLKKGEKNRKKAKGQPLLASQQDVSEADILEDIDRAISEDSYNQTSKKRYTSNPTAGLSTLPELVK